ncbi:MAG: rod shape-determining protein MreC [Pseudomonadota bacterium]|nr:rod shape-determining protein MreC [Pseudomonadota bacterium]
MYGSFNQFGGLALSMRLFLAAVVSVTVMVADARFDLFKDWRNWFMDASTPFIYSAESPSIFLSSAANSFTTKGAYAREIRSLRNDIAGTGLDGEAGSFDEELKDLKIDITSLRSDILRYQALKRENEHLRALLESPVRFDSRKKVAEILEVDTDPSVRQVIINAGTRDHVYEGQPVVSDEGIVGQVMSAGYTISRVILITDSMHQIPVSIAGRDLRAIATGTGGYDELYLDNFSQQSELSDGDLVLTSGLGGKFPEGYPVGRIHVKGGAQGGSRDYMVKPIVDFSSLRYVLLLWNGESGKRSEKLTPEDYRILGLDEDGRPLDAEDRKK